MNTFRIHFWVWAILLIAVLARAEVAPESDRAENRTFLWRISSGDEPSYLLGSLHAAQDDMYPLPAPMEAAFASSDTLVVEADVTSVEPARLAQMVLARALSPSGADLASVMSEDSMQKLEEILLRNGMPLAMVQPFKPWYVSQLIAVLELQRLGIDPERGIDLHFLEQAKGDKNVLELEGLIKQLDFLDSLTEEEQILALEYTLRDFENLEGVMDELIETWRSGDAEKFGELLTGYMSEDEGLERVYELLFDERNEAMFAKITELLKTGDSYFIIVGAGHVVGDKGLVRKLSDAGIETRQVGAVVEPVAAEAQ